MRMFVNSDVNSNIVYQKKVLDQNAKWLKRRKNFYETRNIVDGIKLLGSLNCYPRLRQYLGDWYLIYLRK